MDEPVKRNYQAVRRAESARRTRRAIVAAATELFLRDGFGRTTVDAVARAAAVSRKTVFRSVGGKVELLKVAMDWAVTGDDEAGPLAARPEIAQLAGQADGAAILAEWAALTAAIDSRVAGLSLVLAEAAGLDPAAREQRVLARSQRFDGGTAFADLLATRGLLRADVSARHAADIVWLHSDPAIYHQLVVERDWTHEQFVGWLAGAVNTQLLK